MSTRRSRTPGRSLAVAAVAAMLLSLVACTSSLANNNASSSSSTTSRPVLKIATAFMPSSLDPAEGASWAVYSFLETLTQTNAQGQVVPFLLTKAPQQSDPTHWKLTLRAGVTFQDGHAMTAKIVAAAMNRTMKLNDVAQSELPGAVFAATGPEQITVTTPRAEYLLPYALADSTFGVYDEPVVAAAGTAPAALVGKGVFTAPYSITSFSLTGMTFKAYDKYWQGTPALSGVDVTLVTDDQARLAAVQSGQVDIADDMNSPDVTQTLHGAQGVQLNLSSLPFNAARIYFNPSTAPFNDETVRRAVTLALNYNSLATQFTGRTGEPADGLLPSDYSLTVPTQTFNLAEAEHLLSSDGWAVGPNGIRVKGGKQLKVTLLTYNERPVFQPLSIGIQTMLAKAGIAVNIVSEPYSDNMYSDASRWNLALYMNDAISRNGVPDSYIADLLTSKGSGNYWHMSDPTLDGMFNTLSHATTPIARKADLTNIQKYVWSHAYVVSVAFFKDGSVVSSKYMPSYRPDVGYEQEEWDWRTKPS
jgi:peptide/nickel transport system substrate-binding protein